ncbi:hypothetical protein KCH_20000 [Kitasatospora cheerisanensis KCTC 2395]|uniref:Uncharacterized protein n=1 Tax=Kitasatospora cheerisanensis KCTC 2395 TaxID=1348663 RepID=A0A066YXE7_9ACTN|nr:hypothetical protein KCH_20000 [Kitasatospora cheerisanensis KCTC 2395]
MRMNVYAPLNVARLKRDALDPGLAGDGIVMAFHVLVPPLGRSIRPCPGWCDNASRPSTGSRTPDEPSRDAHAGRRIPPLRRVVRRRTVSTQVAPVGADGPTVDTALRAGAAAIPDECDSGRSNRGKLAK